jgi:hypothetical protein
MNKKNISSIFWGIVFILGGGALLADRLGWIDFNLISASLWVYIFAGLSLLFLLSFFLNGFKQWGWLFPTLIFAALSLTIWLAENEFLGSFLGTPILLAIALPFYIGFLVDRKNWGLLIPAWVMTILSIMTIAADTIEGTFIGALFLFSIAIPFLIVFLINRKHKWALIPAWVTFILGAITLLSNHVNGNLIAALFMYGTALPFLVIYLYNRSQRWALIPAIIIAILGTVPLISSIGGDWVGPLVMFLFSTAFFISFFRWKDAWWTLIPGGIFASIGVVSLLELIIPQNLEFLHNILTGILFLCFGLIFGCLWLGKAKWATEWAKYPAVGLFTLAVLAVLFQDDSNLLLPIILLLAGIGLVIYTFLRRKPDNQSK